tara:strand:- start:451 stop:1644 length:1194 start_codon:yes stop_codon:yes gene_type:complete
MNNFLLLILSFIFVLEFFIYITVKLFKKNNWILTKKKKFPEFKKNKIFNFFFKSYHPLLGWDKKPGRIGYDNTDKKKIIYKIEKNGSRSYIKKFKKTKIITYGDSYAFCRNVNDNETWQYFLSKKTQSKVLNFGVGNYGIDQSLLKYKITKNLGINKIIIFAFVPETICRVQSQWKNFLEFGNIFGFKPAFSLKGDKLILKKNYITDRKSFNKIKKIIKKLSKEDRFYSEKFEKNLFQFPYIFNFFRHFSFNLKFFFTLYLTIFANKKIKQKIIDYQFSLIMKKNLSYSHNLYLENYSQKLLEKLLSSIYKLGKKRKHKIIFINLPQLFDLKLKSHVMYKKFYKRMNESYNIIDFTEIFKKYNYSKLYDNDVYGGHLSNFGNKIVAKELLKYLKKNN